MMFYRGVLTFINATFINKKLHHHEGRLIIVECTLAGQNLTLINVYSPNNHSERKEFLKSISEHVDTKKVLFWEAISTSLKTQELTKRGGGETEMEPRPRLTCKK